MNEVKCLVNVDMIDFHSGAIGRSRHLVTGHTLKTCLIKLANMSNEWTDNVIQISVERLPDEEASEVPGPLTDAAEEILRRAREGGPP